MKVLISGSNGLIGGALREALLAEGCETGRLVRRREQAGERDVYWSFENSVIDRERLEGWDAVVHLAGESIAGGRWTKRRKRLILTSRADGTLHLARCLAQMSRRPAVMISASATGFYGDTGDTAMTEGMPAGSGFLAEVCRAWEAAAQPAREAGIRVVHPRFGVVLSRKGGALAKMLTPFRFGLGGALGGGNQYMAWIHLRDAISALIFLLHHGDIDGPVNVTAPNPMTNRDFTQTLARVLRRPAILPAPAPLLRIALGEMADEALLASNRVIPARLQHAGFPFQFPDLEAALRDLLD